MDLYQVCSDYAFGAKNGPALRVTKIVLHRQIYYCHKVKHIPFDNTNKVLETVRIEAFERYQKFIVVDTKSRISEI